MLITAKSSSILFCTAGIARTRAFKTARSSSSEEEEGKEDEEEGDEEEEEEQEEQAKQV